MTAELEELRLIHSSVVEKIEQARLDKEAIEKRLTDNEVYVGKLQNTVAQLKNEKDTQAGLNRSLQEEKELIKVRICGFIHYSIRVPKQKKPTSGWIF